MTEDYLQISFVVRKVKRKFEPALEIPPSYGWKWHYECFAQVYLVKDIRPENAVEFFGYRVDGKVYSGMYVPAGYKYRIYHIGGGCIDYGIETLEQAINDADELLEQSLQRLVLCRPKDIQEKKIDFTGQQLLLQEVGRESYDIFPRIVTPLGDEE